MTSCHIHLIIGDLLLLFRSSQVFYRCGDICVTELFHKFLGTLDHGIRNTGKLGHLDTITLVCTTLYDLTQEYDIIALFFDRDTVIVDTVQSFLPARSAHDNGSQTVSLHRRSFGIADMFDHCPGNGQDRQRYWFHVRSHPGSEDCWMWHFVRILATSVISTIKVLCPLARSSDAPTRVKIRSTIPMFALSAGTKLPICAISTIRAVWRIYVDFPAMFGPVMMEIRLFAVIQIGIVGNEHIICRSSVPQPDVGRP